MLEDQYESPGKHCFGIIILLFAKVLFLDFLSLVFLFFTSFLPSSSPCLKSAYPSEISCNPFFIENHFEKQQLDPAYRFHH